MNMMLSPAMSAKFGPVTIVAVCDFRYQDWIIVGHTREQAEENYKAASTFHAKPHYRVIITPKRRFN